MKVYVLQVTQESDSPYNEWEWVNKGIFLKEEDAETVGRAYVNSNPTDEYCVGEVTVVEELRFS